jgi:hypothetical protein
MAEVPDIIAELLQKEETKNAVMEGETTRGGGGESFTNSISGQNYNPKQNEPKKHSLAFDCGFTFSDRSSLVQGRGIIRV